VPSRRPPKIQATRTPMLLQQAVGFRRTGQWQQANQCYRQILASEPTNVQAMCGLALSLSRLGSLADGVKAAREAVRVHPRHPECHVTLGQLLHSVGEIDEAIEHCDRSIKLDPKNPSPYAEKSLCLESIHRLDDALATVEKAVTRAPGDPFPISLKAKFLAQKKEDEAARALLEELVKSPKMYTALSRTVWHELGKVRDRLGDYDGAYQAFAECGRVTSGTSLAGKCDRHVRYQMIEILKAGFTPERISKFSTNQFSDVTPAPAFLVGFPRSGTTMTEQIMASHPKIETSDERPFMNHVRGGWAKLVGGSAEVGGMLDRMTADHVKELRKLYWDRVEAAFGTRFEGKAFVDKLPLNLNNLGLINLVFPDAKIITALRDPRDVCLSCFIQDFRLNNAMIHFLTLENSARFYEKVMDLYLHYRKMMTLDYIEVRYEDTVSDLEAQARRILDHLGVDWCDEVLRFYEQASKKYISTPSFTAVTQPVHRKAVNRWRNYASYFEPVQNLLKRFVVEFGYDE